MALDLQIRDRSAKRRDRGDHYPRNRTGGLSVAGGEIELGQRNFELDNPNKNMDAVSARSWITLDLAKKLIADCGKDFDALKNRLSAKDFRRWR